MAHELEFHDGRANFFEVGVERSAWHREGVLLPDAPDLDTAIALMRAGYTVEKRGVKILGPDGQVLQLSTKAFCTVRTDTGAELGAVGRYYEPIQNLDALRAFEPLIDAGVLRLETGGVLRDGARIWLLGRFDVSKFGPICREVFADEVLPYALASNAHDLTSRAKVQTTQIRVVCANTLALADLEDGVSVAHTEGGTAKVIEAAETVFGAIVARHEVVAAQYRLLKATILSAAQFQTACLDVVAPDPRAQPAWNPEARMANAVVARYEQKAGELTRLWHEGQGHTGDDSAWEAYNGVVEAIDHDTELFPTRTGVYRTASLMGGRLGEMKAHVLANLVTLAGGEVGHG